jgi:G6PDH family F420-dependent oxidoreductase
MAEIGYKLSSEEFGPNELVRQARMAEERGFTFALISDHFHPWLDAQGQSPFVWSVIGALAHATERLRVGTGVTCPILRTHPAIVAQAAATAAAMMPGRFFLGLGSGENLNEHILGEIWPETEVRQERLLEAVEVIRLLFQGGLKSHHGKHFTVENARLYTRPEEPPPIYLAAGGPRAAQLAAERADGMVGTAPDRELLAEFDRAGGRGKPRYGEVTVCWAEREEAARRTVRAVWPIAAISGGAMQELPLPSNFEGIAELVTEDALAPMVACGPDPARHVEALRKYVDAGYTHVCVHQVGPEQEGFMRFYEREVLPRLARTPKAA